MVGPPEVTDRLLAGLVGQLCTAHPPGELAVAVAGRDPSWDWVGRLPHVVGAPDLLGAGGTTARRVMVAAGAATPAGGPSRLGLGSRASSCWPPCATPPTCQRDAVPCCPAPTPTTGTSLDTGSERLPVTLDLVGPWWTDRLSRALAPLREVGGGASGAALPRRVTLPEVLGVPGITVEHVLERWKGASPRGATTPAGRRPPPSG